MHTQVRITFTASIVSGAAGGYKNIFSARHSKVKFAQRK
jgi:hypothetical protein